MIRYSRAQQLARKFDELEGMGNTDREPEPIPDLVQGKEPNPEDPPYRERPPGGPPWPGYPKPMPPGGPPTKLAHAIPGEHGHPGGMGFDNEQVPQRQDLIINPSDSTEGVKFPMPIRGGGEGREQPMMTPQFGPNDPHPGELA